MEHNAHRHQTTIHAALTKTQYIKLNKGCKQ